MRIPLSRAVLAIDAAARLGVAPVLRAAWHRSSAGRWVAARRLRDPVAPAVVAFAPDAAVPDGLPVGRSVPARLATARANGLAAAEATPGGWGCAALVPALAAPARLAPPHVAAIGRAAATVGEPAWLGAFAAGTPALALNLTEAGDIRPVWERNRWAELPLLAQAAELDPDGGHLARASAWLAGWHAANPAFHGPNWACGQEASLRALHFALALGLSRGKLPTGRTVFGLHGQRIAATPAYALAQDNNHTVSEAAGLLVCGLGAGEADWVRTGAARLDAALLRLVAPCGTFAQFSTGYHRLLLDVASVAEWLRRRHGAPPLGDAARARLGAATEWLHRLTDPVTGATPRLGHQDGSCFADLSFAGPADARGSVERAARLFLGASAGWADDPGCAWLGLPTPGPVLSSSPLPWAGEGVLLRRSDAAWALLRTGPLRFRPGHADLLHLDLWDGPRNVLRDGGTGAYNPPAEHAWWHAHFTGTPAHNTIAFDDRDQMPRAGRFLFARWPATGALEDGGWMRDHRGCRHARTVHAEGRRWTVEDALAGPFREAVLRWRLCPGDWRAIASGVAGAAARLTITADAPLAVALETGWESPAYGVVVPCPVLVARAAAPVGRFTTIVDLP